MFTVIIPLYLELMLWIEPLSCWVNKFIFSTTWGCVSLPRSTTSSGWKLLIFIQKTEHLQLLMFQHPFSSQCQWFDRLMKQIKTTIVVISRIMASSGLTCLHILIYLFPQWIRTVVTFAHNGFLLRNKSMPYGVSYTCTRMEQCYSKQQTFV